MSQTVNGITTNYVLDSASPLTQVLQDGTNSYIYGVDRIAQMNGTVPEYFLTDGLGSARQLVDNNGAVILTKSYDPYGTGINSVGSGLSSYGFTGEMTDPTGLLYLRTRYYASETGRFTTRDIWEGDENIPMSYNRWLYAYAQPITNTDPSGLMTYNHLIFSAFTDGYDNQHKMAPRWTNQKMNAVNQALTTIAIAYANAYNSKLAQMGLLDDCSTYEFYIDPSTPKIDPFSAFLRVHGGKITFDLRPESPPWWGELHTSRVVYIYASTNWKYLLENGQYLDRFITHEMGHVFERAYTDALQTSSFPLSTAMNRAGINDRVGFAGGYLEWQMSDRNLNYEIFADMYVGWVFNSWARKPNIGESSYKAKLHIYEEGLKKSGFMSINMPTWITEMIFSTYQS